MDHATQVALIRRVFSFFDSHTTELAAGPSFNPVAAYTSPQRLAAERDLLFRREPLLVGLSGDLAEPGSYLVADETGVPVLVVRTKEGALRGYVGLCRHRGAPIATGAGRIPGVFTCPYHGWAYDESGRVAAQPCREGFAGIHPDDLALINLPVAERHGLIFARAEEGDAIDVDAHLGGMQHELAPFDLARYVPFARHRSRRRMNWKLIVDTFLEAYHVTTLHARTLSPAIHGSPAAWDSFGRCGRMIAVRRSLTDLRAKPEAEWTILPHAVILYLVFPNTILIHQIDHVEVVRAYPDAADPDLAELVVDVYTPGPVTTEKARRHFQRNLDLLIQVTETEDFLVGEQIQRGFRARPGDSIVYGRNEPGLVHYHQMLAATLGRSA